MPLPFEQPMEIQLIQPGKLPLICDLSKAYALAAELKLNLVQIPYQKSLYKLIDAKKVIYDKTKKERVKKQCIKEIKLSLNISEHDLSVKANQVQRLLRAGAQVKISLLLNRNFIHQSQMLLLKLSKEVEHIGFVEQLPRDEQQHMTMVIVKKNGL